MWSLRQVLLAFALAGLGGGAWWVMKGQDKGEAPRAPRERTPDYVVSHFTAVETDDTGRPQRRLRAVQMRQFVSEGLAELDSPRLSLIEPEGPPWEAESRLALVLEGGDKIQLKDSVLVHRAGFANNRPVRLSTSELEVWPKRQYAKGDQPTRIDSDRDWLTASGVEAWYAEPARATFPGRVHIYLAPSNESGSQPQEHRQ